MGVQKGIKRHGVPSADNLINLALCFFIIEVMHFFFAWAGVCAILRSIKWISLSSCHFKTPYKNNASISVFLRKPEEMEGDVFYVTANDACSGTAGDPS
jgi:hypothetical protein